MHGLIDVDISVKLTTNQDTRTRGHSLKLSVTRCKYDIRKYSFCMREVDMWNSLPEAVVNATSINTFKNYLDSYALEKGLYYSVDS